MRSALRYVHARSLLSKIKFFSLVECWEFLEAAMKTAPRSRALFEAEVTEGHISPHRHLISSRGILACVVIASHSNIAAALPQLNAAHAYRPHTLIFLFRRSILFSKPVPNLFQTTQRVASGVVVPVLFPTRPRGRRGRARSAGPAQWIGPEGAQPPLPPYSLPPYSRVANVQPEV